MNSFTFCVTIWLLQFEPELDDDDKSKSQYEEKLISMS